MKSLTNADFFEAELHKTFVGSKRFSLQGAETLMPMLSALVERCGSLGVQEVLIGMAHRGRLNVLAQIAGKPFEEIFREFKDETVNVLVGAGDVKYHLGHSAAHQTASGQQVTVEVAPNPSHLEFINPVVEGAVRAKQDLRYESDPKQALAVLIHGDAAVIGQGVVAETSNFAYLPGYTTRGTLHVVINNQIGFTTNPDESRSSPYCTDLVKGSGCPVFHVNFEDVEAACRAIELGIEFRNRFGKDVWIDLVCYRKYGHNEGDDPTYTQPLMYAELKSRKPVAQLYAEKLLAEEALKEADFSSMQQEFVARFKQARENANAYIGHEACPTYGRIRSPGAVTFVSKEILRQVAESLVKTPEDFAVHPKLKGILEKRIQSLHEGQIDFGFAEVLAHGSLILDGVNVRISGQDVGRGTFSHRHLLLSDVEDAKRCIPLRSLQAKGKFEIYNSSLSEAAVLAFEFGYAGVATESLVIWEAQFGDFSNGAQVIIDQFISSSEAKWAQRSGVTLFLPHGYEGQGPEHSSARLERYLQLAAEGNMTICYPSTAAQHFHMIRRQGLSHIKRPTIVMTPKSLLRAPESISPLAEFTDGGFKEILETIVGQQDPKAAVMCSGKVYYDLMTAIKNSGIENKLALKIIRVEQLYPFPAKQIEEAVSGITRVCWLQEEPRNMGAWSFVKEKSEVENSIKLEYYGRAESASTACGSYKRHNAEQKQLLENLLSSLVT